MRQYLNLMRSVLDGGEDVPDRTGTGCRSLKGASLTFDLTRGFPLVTTRRIYTQPLVGELLAFIRGYDNAADFRALGCKFWDANANENRGWRQNLNRKGTDDLGRIYGTAWRSWRFPRTQPPPKLRQGCPATYLGIANGSGSYNHPLGSTWEGMILRCYSPGNVSYPLYGAVGVHVCNRWLEFSAFAEDAVKLPGYENKQGSKPFEYQLDKDIKGDEYTYGPNTCMWVSASENSEHNRVNSYVVEKDGVEYSFSNVEKFCKDQGIDSRNFSDLWTGRKNAKIRHGFRFVRVDTPTREPRGVKATDQLAEVVSQLQNNPHDRRIICTAWNPGELNKMALPPCHMFFQCGVETGGRELVLAMYQRSCDLFLGVPYNIASYALLTHLLAEATGLVPGRLVLFMYDVHLYHNHFEQAREQLSREPFPAAGVRVLPITPAHTGMEYLESLEPGDIEFYDYRYHPPIKADMAV